MRCVIQRVKRASVTVDNEVTGAIDKGIMVLSGFAKEDDVKTFEYMAGKLINLRIFEDSDGKMNLSVKDVEGGILLVPNFTLYGDTRHGRRPGYTLGADPNTAREIYDKFAQYLKSNYEGKVEFGVFQADMDVELINDGPVTLLLDSDKLF
jgi:D-tyrosyl-tRNA(Tyr) deacylase